MTVKKLIISTAILFVACNYTNDLLAQKWASNELYVSGNGNDANDGKTSNTAFRTLQKAADVVKAGDVVVIGNGNYTSENRASGSAVLSITTSGTKQQWITWKAAPGATPQIRPGGWAGIQVAGSYHIFDGLSVTGANDSIVLLKAQEDAKKQKPDPHFNTNGIFINGRERNAQDKPHHIIVRNCTVSKCPGGGITAIEADYFTIENCKVFDNAWFMRYGGSGITTLNNWAFDDAPGYHVIIQNNLVWNNKTLVPWERINKLSDGNGILLDVTDQARQGATNPNADAVVKPNETPAKTTTDNKPARPEWKGRALIANNVSAYNGGSGIHTFRTKHVDVINNTTYHNGGIVGYQEMFANNSEDVVFLNNIIVPRPGGQVTSNNKNTNIRWDYNVYSVSQTIYNGANDIVADPLFESTPANLTFGSFRLKKGSPGINSGTNEVPQEKDITGKKRPAGAGRDRGAYEQ